MGKKERKKIIKHNLQNATLNESGQVTITTGASKRDEHVAHLKNLNELRQCLVDLVALDLPLFKYHLKFFSNVYHGVPLDPIKEMLKANEALLVQECEKFAPPYRKMLLYKISMQKKFISDANEYANLVQKFNDIVNKLIGTCTTGDGYLMQYEGDVHRFAEGMHDLFIDSPLIKSSQHSSWHYPSLPCFFCSPEKPSQDYKSDIAEYCEGGFAKLSHLHARFATSFMNVEIQIANCTEHPKVNCSPLETQGKIANLQFNDLFSKIAYLLDHTNSINKGIEASRTSVYEGKGNITKLEQESREAFFESLVGTMSGSEYQHSLIMPNEEQHKQLYPEEWNWYA